MKQEIDNNAMWAAFRQELALQGELHVVTAIDNALNNLGFTIEETSTIISIPLKQGETSPVLSNSSNIGKVEQKFVWSEEDEKMFDYALNMIEWYGCVDKDKSKPVSDWLKSLKDRVQPQQEWSEEDLSMIGEIRSIIEKYAFSQSAVDVNGELCEKEFIDADNWLKSLRPQNTWKPSEEQLNVLWDIVVSKKAGSQKEIEDICVITELFEQLKAL